VSNISQTVKAAVAMTGSGLKITSSII